MGNYSSTPTVGENAGGDDTRPSFYGITPSGELLDRGLVFDSDLDVTLQNAFEKGKADGISSVQEMIVSLAEGERKKLQDSMVELNLKHKESAKELAKKLEASIISDRVKTRRCEEQCAALHSSLNPHHFVDLKVSLDAVSSYYICSQKTSSN